MQLSFPLHRVFLALPLEGEAKMHFQELQKRLREYEDLFRFQNPETPHLSLYFWSTVMEIEHGQIVRQAEKIAARTKSFTIQVTEAETFGGGGRGVARYAPTEHVLFLSISRSSELSTLKKLCPWPQRGPLPKGEPFGLRGPNLRPFSPHITLARMRNPNEFHVHKKKIMKLLRD
ncbi:MAG: 2'-5' RNA ligase family protein, partial [Patescibacteria group bacterium]